MESKALIIEDDPEMQRLLRSTVGEIGLFGEIAESGPDGLKLALEHEYLLLLVDVTLPGLDGFTICERVRQARPRLPIIMVTNKVAETDKVQGLLLGADDYVAKPFGTKELGARIIALLRRAQNLHPVSIDPIEEGELVFDPENREVRKKVRGSISPRWSSISSPTSCRSGGSLSLGRHSCASSGDMNQPIFGPV